MQSPRYFLLAAALVLPFAAFAATPASHDHGHDSAAPQQMVLNAGKKWTIDAPLRQGMLTMHSAVKHTLPAAHAGKATAADYDALGAKVSAQVAYIVENCKLQPQADEQLHTVIAQLLSGIEAVQGQQGEGERASGVVKMAQALNTYGQYFEHAGWKAIAVPH